MHSSWLRFAGYTVIDDLSRRFEDFIASTPGWLVAAVIVGIGIALIIGIAKRLVVLWLVAALVIGTIACLWFYSGYFLA